MRCDPVEFSRTLKFFYHINKEYNGKLDVNGIIYSWVSDLSQLFLH